jgi:hypothetical protein
MQRNTVASGPKFLASATSEKAVKQPRKSWSDNDIGPNTSMAPIIQNKTAHETVDACQNYPDTQDVERWNRKVKMKSKPGDGKCVGFGEMKFLRF